MKLDKNYDEQFTLMLKTYCNEQKMLEKEYVSFYPQVGKEFQKELDILFIGRAVNGWGTETLPTFSNKKLTSKINDSYFQGIKEYSTDGTGYINKCPLGWLVDEWDNYGMGKRPIFRLIRDIAKEHHVKNYSKELEENWTHHFAWSNLYKIAPKNGGNPDAKIEWQTQDDHCEKLIEMELEQLQPKYAIFITDMNWLIDGEPYSFIKNAKEEVIIKNDFIEATYLYNKTKIIITKRPEFRPGEEFFNEIKKHINL